MHEHFRVAVGAKAVASSFEFAREFHVVVDLALKITPMV
jgi:hypothetical protein